MITHTEDTSFDPPIDTIQIDPVGSLGFGCVVTGARDAEKADVDLQISLRSRPFVTMSLAEARQLIQIIEVATATWEASRG